MNNIWTEFDVLETNIETRIIKDSLRESNGTRITTMLWRVPRFLLPQLNTYRVFSRNVSSCLTGENVVHFEVPSAISGYAEIHSEMIEDIYRNWHVGDKRKYNIHKLRCYDFTTQQFKTTFLKDIRFEGIKQVFKVYFSNGRNITMTADHRFLTTNGWSTLQQEALRTTQDNYKPADIYCLGINSEKYMFPLSYLALTDICNIVKVEDLGEQKVYDLEVTDESESFICNGIVVHNSRAKRFSKTVEEVRENPYVPYIWQADHKGMQTSELLPSWKVPIANAIWDLSMRFQTLFAEGLSILGVSKQYTNRLIEPYMYVDYLVTSTSYENFFEQRDNYHAQLEIQVVARRAKLALECNEPTPLKTYEWHLPFIKDEELEEYGLYNCIKISVARCARTSYGTPNDNNNLESDTKLFARLAKDGHFSPFEHQVLMFGSNSGNLTGCTQLRKMLEVFLKIHNNTFNDEKFKMFIESHSGD
jgi:hypothetical protein